MRIPDTVKIGDMTYTVMICNEPIIVSDRCCMGSIDYVECIIRLSRDLSDEQRKHTLWHEIIHGIYYDRKINLFTDNEDIVDSLASGVLQVVRDNPELFHKESKKPCALGGVTDAK